MEVFERARATAERTRSRLPGRDHPYVATVLASVIAIVVLVLLAGEIKGGQAAARAGLSEWHDQRAELAGQFVTEYTSVFAGSVRLHGQVVLAADNPTGPEISAVARSQGAIAAVLFDDRATVIARYSTDIRATEAVEASRSLVPRLVADMGSDVRAVPAETQTVGAVLVVTSAFRAAPSGDIRVLSVAVPLSDTSLPSFLGKVVPISGQRSFLLDGQGRVLVRSGTAESAGVSRVDRMVIAASEARWHGEVDTAGSEVYFSSARLRSPDWRVVAVVPAGSLYRPVNGNLRSSWLAYWVVVAMTIMGIGLFGRALRRERLAERKALVDQLTDIANRRQLEDALSHLTTHPELRWGALMIDVDHFKRVNDKLGHAAGDAALRRVAHAISSVVRPDDIVGRWGGEEFIVLVNDGGDDLCSALAERVRASVEAIDDVEAAPLTVSVGWASADRFKPSRVLNAADTALYEAKRAGRNRVATIDRDSTAH